MIKPKNTHPREDRSYPASIKVGIPKLISTPPGWSRFHLRELLRISERPVDLDDHEIYQLLTAKRNRGGIVGRGKFFGADIKTKKQFLVKHGDFLISNRQISHGACGIVPKHLDGSIVSNEYTVINTNQHLNVNYLEAMTNSIYFQQTCFHSSIGVHVEKLVFRIDNWLNWEFNIPPINEQNRIVSLIKIWKQAVEGTEHLLTLRKKRKEYLVCKLLNDLPKIKLTEVSNIWFSSVDKKTIPDEIPVKLCNYTDVFYNSVITSNTKFMMATARKNEIDTCRLQKHDVIFTKDSETPNDIARCALVKDDIDNLVCGYHLAVARPHTRQAWGPFIAHALRHPEVRSQFSRLANGAVRYGLTLGAIDQIEIPFADIHMQKKISSTIDNEETGISILESQAKLLKTQKEALTMNLITGELRLDKRFDDATFNPDRFLNLHEVAFNG